MKRDIDDEPASSKMRRVLSKHKPSDAAKAAAREICKRWSGEYLNEDNIYHVIDQALASQVEELRQVREELASHEEVLADHHRLVRAADVAINGEAGAAKQASLCDLIPQLAALASDKARLDWLDEFWCPHMHAIIPKSDLRKDSRFIKTKTVRQAIDKAMADAAAKAKP